MRPQTAQTLAWVLIYSGLLLAALGWFVQDGGAAWGHALWIIGLADAAAGIGLIWWRSKMKDTDT